MSYDASGNIVISWSMESWASTSRIGVSSLNSITIIGRSSCLSSSKWMMIVVRVPSSWTSYAWREWLLGECPHRCCPDDWHSLYCIYGATHGGRATFTMEPWWVKWCKNPFSSTCTAIVSKYNFNYRLPFCQLLDNSLTALMGILGIQLHCWYTILMYNAICILCSMYFVFPK